MMIRRLTPFWPWLLLGLCGLIGLVAGLRGPSPPAVRSAGQSAPARMASARAAIDAGDLESARGHLDELLKADPGHVQGLLYRGQVRREQGDLPGALTDWRRVPDEAGRDAGIAAYLESTVLLEQGDAVAAEERLRASMRLHPQYLQPQQRLLELLVVQMRRDDILRHLQEVRRRRRWSMLEQVFALVPPDRATTPDAGAELMREYLRRRPDDRNSRLALGRYLLLSGDVESARDELRLLVSQNPEDDEATARLAETWLMEGGPAEAEQLLKRFPPGERATAPVLRAWGRLAVARGDWPAAADSFERVLRIRPEDLGTRYQLGRVYQRQGRRADAESTLERAERVDALQKGALRLVWGSKEKLESMISIALDVGDLLIELDRPTEAAEWYQQVLAISPHEPRATVGLEQARVRQLAGESSSRPDEQALFTPIGPSHGVHRGVTDPVSGAVNSTIRFEDVQERAGLDHQYFNGATAYKYLVESTGGGVAVLDYDRDGWSDLYFPQGCHLPVDESDLRYVDRLYRNRAGRDFAHVAEASRIIEPRYGQGLAAGDVDADGFPDVVVANYGENTLLRNNGDGTFSEVSQEAGLDGNVMSSSVALADFNRDGLLDLYVANYVDSMKVCQNTDGSYSTCNPSNFEGEQDRLYLNRGDGTFHDLTADSGVQAEGGKGLGVLVSDLNRDGWPDIYVANDTTPNFLFTHLGTPDEPAFAEIGLQAGVALSGEGRSEAGMGIAGGDLDGNGLPDLYVTNFFQETNTLYLNEGGNLFTDSTAMAGLATPTHGWLAFGTQSADFDRDGHLDLLVANGHIDDFRMQGEPWKMPPQVFQNRAGGRFDEVSATAGPYFGGEYLGRGVARIDWNRDGLQDIVIVHQDRPVALLENQTEEPGYGVVLELYGTASNRDAVGAVVTVTAGSQVQVHEVTGGDGFFATNERQQCIGIGKSASIDRLEVVWPSGHQDLFEDLPAEHRIVVVEGHDPRLLPLASPRQ